MSKLTLAKAKEILPKHVTEDHLFTHAAAVSAAMGAMAAHYGLPAEEKDHWQAIGWLHDVDYEKYPDEHCHHVREFLAPARPRAYGCDRGTSERPGKEPFHRG